MNDILNRLNERLSSLVKDAVKDNDWAKVADISAEILALSGLRDLRERLAKELCKKGVELDQLQALGPFNPKPWSNEPPTVPGWYVRRRDNLDPNPDFSYYSGSPKEWVAGQWCGPIHLPDNWCGGKTIVVGINRI